ncbi:tripartite tricarboxylate transporter TctB family protein [uncultured Cohaesibacter sp.]|uniref:tripartite tricarboxylate transporter TctB family protein n=1 Tax=uncultured Cohaesibacter sp. TaxID=1002546 RepID=UPI0029C7D8E1|nr:tripartite tricarboxylate transporter TctB family protein [uncultured Cohaesibacter sp.]
MNSKRHMIWGQWVVLMIMFGVVGLVFQQIATSFAEQGAASGDALSNAALFPRYVALAIALLGAVIGLQMMLGAASRDGGAEVPAEDEDDGGSKNLIAKELAVATLTVVYLLLITPLGFHITSFLVIGAMFYVLDARPLWKVLLVSAVLTLICSFVFEGLLKIVLPLGFMNFTLPYHMIGL